MIDEHTQRRVLAAIERPPMPVKLVGRDIDFGDAAWIAALDVINGPGMYCSRCLWAPGAGVFAIGDDCPICEGGIFVPGARGEARWRAAIELGEEMCG